MIDAQLWNDILERSLEGRAVDVVLASEVPPDFDKGAVPRILSGMSWRGVPVDMMEALYLLSMVAFTGNEFSFRISTKALVYRPQPNVNFLAIYKSGFVVGAAGPTLRDNGSGLRDAINKALAELAAAAGPPEG